VSSQTKNLVAVFDERFVRHRRGHPQTEGVSVGSRPLRKHHRRPEIPSPQQLSNLDDRSGARLSCSFDQSHLVLRPRTDIDDAIGSRRAVQIGWDQPSLF
jgi:hypothetical protein